MVGLRSGLRVLPLMLGLLLSACLSQEPPAVIHHYAPSSPASEGQGHSPAKPLPVVIRRVTAAPHLGQKMIWRTSEYELRVDETHRWIDEPIVFVEQCVREFFLFQKTPPTETSKRPWQLELHLTRFEGSTSDLVARLALHATLVRPSDDARFTRAISVEPSLGSQDPAALARAMSEALLECGGELLDWFAEVSSES